MVHGLEGEYWGRVDFVYIDREDPYNRGVVERYGIHGQPVIVLVHPDGTEMQRWYGFVSESDLRVGLDGVIGQS